MPLADDIEEFRRNVTKAIEELEEVRGVSDKLTECTVDEIHHHLTQLQDLCEQVSLEIKRSTDQLIEINARWGSEPLKKFISRTSSFNTDFSSPSAETQFKKGEHGNYLNRYYWNSQDGESMQQYREIITTNEKRFVSQIQGESWGHLYVTEILGYKEIFHGDSKSIRQGFDGVYLDPKDNALIIAEFKGQKSLESKAQKRPTWTLETCQKIRCYQFPYNNVSEFEREAATFLLQEYQSGRILRYEVIRTEVDPNTGQMWTQLEKQTRLECDLSPP